VVEIEVRARPVARSLLAVVVSLAAGHLAALVWLGPLSSRRPSELMRLLDLNAEANLPTWFSSSLLLLCALLLGLVAAVRRRLADPLARHWLAAAVIFALLSLDEAAAIHELSVKPLRAALGASGALHFTWVVPGALFAFAFALANVRFLRSLPARTRRAFLLAGALYLAGTLGMEMVGGVYHASRQALSPAYRAVVVVEEVLEMLGLVLFAWAILDHLAREQGDVRLSFR